MFFRNKNVNENLTSYEDHYDDFAEGRENNNLQDQISGVAEDIEDMIESIAYNLKNMNPNNGISSVVKCKQEIQRSLSYLYMYTDKLRGITEYGRMFNYVSDDDNDFKISLDKIY